MANEGQNPSEGDPEAQTLGESDGQRALSRALFILFTGLLVAIIYVLMITPTGQYQSKGGQSFPAFELSLIPEGSFSSADLEGHITILNFFATWCGPCRAEMPELVRFAEARGDENIRLIGVSAGYDEVGELLPFLEGFGVNYPIAYGGEGLLKDLNLTGLPTTVIIGPEGKVFVAFEGAITGGQLEAALERLQSTLD